MKRDGGEILFKLRHLMKNQRCAAPITAYIVPSDDEHQNEYIGPHDQRRSFITGFDGSAGVAVITHDKALLWTDGRYYQQAVQQLYPKWTLMKDGLQTTPSIGEWLSNNIPGGTAVGVDPKLLSYRAWKTIEEDLKSADTDLLAIEKNLVDVVWGDDQPKKIFNPIITLSLEFTGKAIDEKWADVKEKMSELKVGALVVTALDEISWFLNLRGSDIDFNPVFFAYLIITPTELVFFVNSSKLPPDFDQHKLGNNVEIEVLEYGFVDEYLRQLIKQTNEKIWISPGSSYYLTNLIPLNRRFQKITPIAINKAIKNNVEVKGFINCHIRDGVALCQYLAWLEGMVQSQCYVDEITGADKLEEFRSKQEFYMGLSFATISSSGPNASVIHYHPSVKTNRQITANEIYLCDSGAQYKDGTTDVTRTVHFGTPTEFEKEAYTRVLKGQLTLGSTVFPKNIKGCVLDTIARKSLWDIGLDYGHGTGHGVGHFLNVHEGPMGIGVRIMPDDPGLQENMIMSNEPGYYEDGVFGIRIEDVVQVVPHKSTFDFKGRGALTFRTLTMCPKQTKLIKTELLQPYEKLLLNEYHRTVWETLAPILKSQGDEITLEWLKRETQPIYD